MINIIKDTIKYGNKSEEFKKLLDKSRAWEDSVYESRTIEYRENKLTVKGSRFKEINALILSHDDLDGHMSAAMAYDYLTTKHIKGLDFPESAAILNTKILIHADPSGETTLDLLAEGNAKFDENMLDVLMITDRRVAQDSWKYVKKGGYIFVWDHHRTSFDVCLEMKKEAEENGRIVLDILDDKFCAAYLVSHSKYYVTRHFRLDNACSDDNIDLCSKFVDDWDMFKWKNYEGWEDNRNYGLYLNILLNHRTTRTDRYNFARRVIDTMTESGLYGLDRMIESEQCFIDEYILGIATNIRDIGVVTPSIDKDGHKFAVLDIPKKYASLVNHFILQYNKNDIDYIVTIIMKTGKITINGKGTVKCFEKAQIIGERHNTPHGGHPDAAGTSLPVIKEFGFTEYADVITKALKGE